MARLISGPNHSFRQKKWWFPKHPWANLQETSGNRTVTDTQPDQRALTFRAFALPEAWNICCCCSNEQTSIKPQLFYLKNGRFQFCATLGERKTENLIDPFQRHSCIPIWVSRNYCWNINTRHFIFTSLLPRACMGGEVCLIRLMQHRTHLQELRSLTRKGKDFLEQLRRKHQASLLDLY